MFDSLYVFYMKTFPFHSINNHIDLAWSTHLNIINLKNAHLKLINM